MLHAAVRGQYCTQLIHFAIKWNRALTNIPDTKLNVLILIDCSCHFKTCSSPFSYLHFCYIVIFNVACLLWGIFFMLTQSLSVYKKYLQLYWMLRSVLLKHAKSISHPPNVSHPYICYTASSGKVAYKLIWHAATGMSLYYKCTRNTPHFRYETGNSTGMNVIKQPTFQAISYC